MAWSKDNNTKASATLTYSDNVLDIESGQSLLIRDSSGDTVASIPDSATGTILFNGQSTAMDFNVRGDSDTKLLYIDASADKIGIGTSVPARALEINHAAGRNLRLTYNDSDGSASNYADFSMSNSGDLTIAPSGGDTNITGNLAVSADLAVTSGLTVAGSSVSGTQLSFLDGVTAGTATASKAVVVDSNKDISGIRNAHFTSSSAEEPVITLDGEASVDSGQGGILKFVRRDSSNATLDDDVIIGTMRFYGTKSDGTTEHLSAAVMARTQGAWNDTIAPTELLFFTAGNTPTYQQRMCIRKNGEVGIGTSAPDKALEINDSSGDQLRLTRGDDDGDASNYADFSISSGGDLTIAPSGGDTNITGSLAISVNADIDGTLEADAITVDGTALNEYIADTVGAMVSSNSETNITVTYQDGDNTLDFEIGTLNQSTTGNASTATALETARNIGGVSFDGTGNIDLPGVNTSGSQDTSGNATTATTAAVATTVTITDNDSTNEDNAIIFTSGGDVDGGNIGLESDSDLIYNPSTGRLTATQLAGTLQTASQGNITTVGTLDGGSITSGFGNIDVGSSSISAGSFDASDGNIANVGDIDADSISVADASAGLSIDFSGGNTGTSDITIADNLAEALVIQEGSNDYLKIVTTNSSESMSIGTGVSGTAITIGHGTSDTTIGDNLIITDAAYFNDLTVVSSSSSTTIDWTNGNKQIYDFDANHVKTLTFTDPASGNSTSCSLTLIVKQYEDTNAQTITWPGSVKWPGGSAPTLSTGNADYDVISFLFTKDSGGTVVYYGSAALDFSAP